MNKPLNDSVQEKLSALDQQIRRRAAFATAGYSAALAGGIGLFVFFPFELSRVGSVVIIVSLAQMIWKVREASRGGFPLEGVERDDPSLGGLGKLDAQIRLVQSLIYNLPFVAGANLFFMGLPGTGSPVAKAWLDCYFLLGTVMLFGGVYWANQQAARKQLLPLRQELEAFVAGATPQG